MYKRFLWKCINYFFTCLKQIAKWKVVLCSKSWRQLLHWPRWRGLGFEDRWFASSGTNLWERGQLPFILSQVYLSPVKEAIQSQSWRSWSLVQFEQRKCLRTLNAKSRAQNRFKKPEVEFQKSAAYTVLRFNCSDCSDMSEGFLALDKLGRERLEKQYLVIYSNLV